MQSWPVAFSPVLDMRMVIQLIFHLSNSSLLVEVIVSGHLKQGLLGPVRIMPLMIQTRQLVSLQISQVILNWK